jgi:hypothetical protein
MSRKRRNPHVFLLEVGATVALAVELYKFLVFIAK